MILTSFNVSPYPNESIMQEKKNDNYLKLGEGKPLRVSLGVSNGVELNGDDGLPLVGLVRSLSACFQFKKNEKKTNVVPNYKTTTDTTRQTKPKYK